MGVWVYRRELGRGQGAGGRGQGGRKDGQKQSLPQNPLFHVSDNLEFLALIDK